MRRKRKEDALLIHFLYEYKIVGRLGDRIRIKGVFPGLKQQEFVFLNEDEENGQAYRIEEIEYSEPEKDNFKAVIAVG